VLKTVVYYKLGIIIHNRFINDFYEMYVYNIHNIHILIQYLYNDMLNCVFSYLIHNKKHNINLIIIIIILFTHRLAY